MSGYTVTIAPSGGQPGPETTVHVDITGGAARVTELSVRGGGNGLASQELPAIDFALLVAALAPASARAITATPAPTAAPAAPARQPRRRRAGSTAQAPATGTRGRRRAEAPQPAKASRGGRRAEAPQPAKATRGRRRAAPAAEAPKTSRAYRRMPAQDEVVGVWNDSHSASGLAAHFDVPRHTAQGWLRRLRSMGLIEPTS